MKVAVIIPSRGLMFSKTAEEIVRNTQGVPHQKFFAHKLPIPDCFEWPTIKALKDPDITHLWFIEDDMILPDDILRMMLNEPADVVTCDYPADKKGRGVVFQARDGKVVFGGLGCTLVKREMMDKLKPPYFRTDIRWHPTNLGTAVMFMAGNPTGKAQPDEYGKQDVNFFMKLHVAEATISLFPLKLGQRKLVKLGQAGSNNGAHVVEEWTKLKPDYWLKYISTFPKEEGSKLKTVKFKDGRQMNVNKAFAKKLIAEGKAEALGPTAFILDTNGVEL
jgi:hypothetical protein